MLCLHSYDGISSFVCASNETKGLSLPQVITNSEELLKFFSHFTVWAENIYGPFLSFPLCQVSGCWCKWGSKCEVGFWYFENLLCGPACNGRVSVPLEAILSLLVSPALWCKWSTYMSPPLRNAAHPPSSHVNQCLCKHNSSSIKRSVI